MSTQRPAVYRAVIDALVRMCRDGQGQIGAERARRGLWNKNATSPAFDEDQFAFNELPSRLSDQDRDVLARMLEQEVTTGVFETLKALEEHKIAPFEDGYEGGPYQDFVGRMNGWEWPK